MNSILSFIFICFVCFFGTRLRIVESSFTKKEPGLSTGAVVTQFDVKVKSTGGKTVHIKDVWLYNNKATWTLNDLDNKELKSIGKKDTYSIQGNIKIQTKAGKNKSKPSIEEEKGSFEEEFVLSYYLGNSEKVRYLKIDKIENIKILKKK